MKPFLLALLATAMPTPSKAATEPTDGGAGRPCIEGSHEPLRVRRLPGTAVSSDRPRDPLQDTQVHCDEEHGESRPGRGPEGRGR